MRVALAVVIVVLMAFGVTLSVQPHALGNKVDVTRIEQLAGLSKANAAGNQTWFAPYVDVTNTPTYPFQVPADDPARQVVLGFVVAASARSCTPSWGDAYSIQQADQSLALGARIAQLRLDGSSVVVSFGGQKNTPLFVACTNTSLLASAYRSVIDAYQLETIDLDMEGAALSDFAGVQRQAAAIAMLQGSARTRHRRLRVWVTVPVEPDGLQGNALSAVDAMLRARVDLAGVNVMTMDFSQGHGPVQDMAALTERSARAAKRQVENALARYGVGLPEGGAWERMGITVMIGQNNVAGQRTTLADAHELVSFARSVGLGRLSMWSLNRDSQCGQVFADLGVLSTTCSGAVEPALGFTKVFDQLSGSVATSSAGSGSATPPVPDTNPANAPYPDWSPNEPYVQGYKVVEQGYIYEARWYNSGQDPAAASQYGSEPPWEQLGPVLPTDHAPAVAKLPTGTYPAWSGSKVYTTGNDVLYDGLAYQAKWYNVGSPPVPAAVGATGSPWQPLYSVPGEPTGS